MKRAFTLAEVLITLGIIGVVAAITIPTLITNYNKEVTAKKLSQAYNYLQQTVQMAQADYGDMSTWDCFLVNTCTDEYFANKYIVPYLKNVKLAKRQALVSFGYKDYPKNLMGETTFTSWVYIIQTSQEYLYMVSPYTLGDNSRATYSVGIDINGVKGPNILGKDIFSTTYGYNSSKKNYYKLQMYNYYNYTRDEILEKDCNKNGGVGEFCGALIEMDGWQIKNDYPW